MAPDKKLHQTSVGTGASFWAAASAFVIWGALASAGVWITLHGFRGLPVGAEPPIQSAAPMAPTVVDWDAVARVVAAPAEPVAANSAGFTGAQPAARVQVMGVVVSGKRPGAALLQVGSERLRPYKVGTEVPGVGWLLAVAPDEVQFAATPNGPVTQRLSVPQRPIAKLAP